MPHYQPILINDFVELDFDWALKQECNYKECAKVCSIQFQRGLPHNLSPADFLHRLKKLYNKNKPSALIKKHAAKHTATKIPHIIHQIWFGGKLPEIYKIWQKRLKKLHPKWEIINWTDNKIAREFPRGLVNKRTFSAAQEVCNYAQMADIARYEILNKFGGLYLDYDTKCLKSFEMLHNLYTFYAGLENFDTSCFCSNATIGAQKGHPILKRCIDLIKKHEAKDLDLSLWSFDFEVEKHESNRIVRTGQKLFTQAIVEMTDLEGSTDIILPQEYFYPKQDSIAALSYHASHSSWKDRIKDHFNERQNIKEYSSARSLTYARAL